MLRNHLKSILRGLKKNKSYTIINISGLAIGFAAAVLIAIFVNQEFTFDKFYKDHERTYRLSAKSFAFSSIAHIKLLKQELAGVEAAVNLMPVANGTLKHDNRNFIETGVFYTTADYLKVFDQTFVYGNAQVALDAPDAMLITESLSKKLFGNKNPIGETIQLSTQPSSDTYQVTGVVKDPPTNATLKFKALARFSKVFEENISSGFFNTIGYAYFKMEGQSALPELRDQIDRIYARMSYDADQATEDFETYLKSSSGRLPWVLPIGDVHLESNLQFEASAPGNRQYLFIFLGIAVFIIVLAAINYVNLATAQASKRAKEVGVRKVLGSVKKNLVARFMTESMLLALFASIIGLGLAEGALQLMSGMGFSNFEVNVYNYPQLVLIILAIAVLTGMLAGLYPAFYLTSFKPSAVLKGDYRTGNRSKNFRNTLVVFQFVVSLSLAIFSVFVYQQLNYGLSKELGFTKEGVIVIDNAKEQLGDEDENVAPFKNELLKMPEISGVASSQYSMIGRLALVGLREKGEEQKFHRAQYKYADAAFVSTMDMEIVDGRGFDDDLDDDRRVLIVNEAFAKTLGEGLYDKRFTMFDPDNDLKIVGVVKDFHANDFSQAIGPTAIIKGSAPRQFNVRIQMDDLNKTLKAIETTYAQFTDEPLDYYFFDQKFDQLFNAEKQMSQIITIFTGLSLFVAVLGMIGLIGYKLDQRIKEIGIRKVLGATISQILGIFSKELSVLILIALLITIPVSFYATQLWLNGFAYHIDMGWLPFAIVGIAGLMVTIIIVTLRTFKTALVNPVDALRSQ